MSDSPSRKSGLWILDNISGLEDSTERGLCRHAKESGLDPALVKRGLKWLKGRGWAEKPADVRGPRRNASGTGYAQIPWRLTAQGAQEADRRALRRAEAEIEAYRRETSGDA